MGFSEIEDQAFAQQGIEKLVHECGNFWFFHQVPHQEPVV